jgi:5-deoxy-glucuronate isomerase
MPEPHAERPSQRALATQHRGGFPHGSTTITTEGEADLDTGVDFSIVVMRRGERIERSAAKETAWVLLGGVARVTVDGVVHDVARASQFDEAPHGVSVPAGAPIVVEAVGDDVEWAHLAASNDARFAPRLFRPADVDNEARGKGLAQNASLRTVRLAFDARNHPDSALVVGEVVNLPGRWSSYPPHHHAQPEIYHYRFTAPQGYGHAELGDDVFKVKQYDTLKILDGRDHPQCAAPGYGMYYLWVVRHQPGAKYTGFVYDEAHKWVLDPAQQGWQPKEQG